MWSRTATSSCSGSTCKWRPAWTTRAAARRAVWRVNSQRSENWSGRIHFARTEVKTWGPRGEVSRWGRPGRRYHPVPLQRVISREKWNPPTPLHGGVGGFFISYRYRGAAPVGQGVQSDVKVLFGPFSYKKKDERKRANRGCRPGPGAGRPGSHRAPGTAGSPPGTCPCPPPSSSPWAHTSPLPG